MRKWLTKFLALAVICVVMFSFTACSLFTTNLDEKYSPTAVIARAADSDITVTKKELYDAYRQWGYQYASQMEEVDLLNALAEAVLNDKILRQISLERLGALTDAEKALARQRSYQTIDKTLRQYIYEALSLTDETASSDADDDKVTYQPYTKTILVTNNGDEQIFTLNLASYTENTAQLSLDDYAKYTPNLPGVADDRSAEKALSKIVRNLKVTETGFEKLKNSTEFLNLDNTLLKTLDNQNRYILNREITRLVENNENSILVSRLNVAFDLGIDTAADWQAYLQRGANIEAWQTAINAEQATGRSIATGRAQNVIDYYQAKVKNAMLNYTLEGTTDFEKNLVSGSLDEVYYIPQNIANNLFTVSHILIGFTDEQKDLYKEINSRAESDPSYDKDAALSELYAATTSNGKNVYEIYNEVKNALRRTDTLQEKYDIFRDLMYQYNTDPGMQNPEYEYLMSTNKDNNKMIEAFTDASIALKEKGQKGAISELVWGEYGAHIIMYTRDVGEFIWTGDQSMLARDYAQTLFATQTAYGNKTKFDTLAEYYTRSYNNYQAAMLREFKSEHEVTIVKSAFKKFL